MTPRRRTYLIVGLGVLAIAAFGVFAWRNKSASADLQTLLPRLPTQDAVVAGIDFDALRASGILGSLLDGRGQQEAEYVDFVRDSGFNYQRDLRYVLASFAPDGEFFLIRGVFDWPRLERYVATQKGRCENHFCRMAGSTNEKNISFFPLQRDLMAMAVARDAGAAERLNHLGPQADVAVLKEPLWLTFSAGALRHSASLEGSSRLFATAIMDAERVTITAGPGSDNHLEARLEAVCRDAQQAGGLTEQLVGLTNLLKRVGAQQQQSIPADSVAGLLASGTFTQAGSHVTGHWDIPRSLLAELAK